MGLLELNALAWKNKKEEDIEITIGNLTWPSKKAFDDALKALYDSLKPFRNYEEKK